jgi:DNA-binding response OmpR family regulator
MRVLVAEDDEGLRELLVLGLAEQGCEVDAVGRGDNAIDQLKWYEYNVAIIDWRMSRRVRRCAPAARRG